MFFKFRENEIKDSAVVDAFRELHLLLAPIDAPALGWNDITADVSAGRGIGANAPTWTTYRGGVKAYAFDNNTMNEIWIAFHIKHDYAEGTKVYPHVHWGPVTTNTGVVRWGFEYTIARGHDQEIFPDTTTVYVNYDVATNKQYQHIISEVVDGDSFNGFEADTLILLRLFRDVSDPADTFPDDVFAFEVDIHFQADRARTKNKVPPFN